MISILSNILKYQIILQLDSTQGANYLIKLCRNELNQPPQKLLEESNITKQTKLIRKVLQQLQLDYNDIYLEQLKIS